MPTAEILTIGTEILLGEIQDTNTAYLARTLKDMGIDLYRTQTVGDNTGRIASIIRDIIQRADILITTGGLGPTVDDPTRQAIADALGVPLEFNQECWEQIQAYFERLNRPMPENNRRQAYLPAGSTPILNPVGTAPGFIVDTGSRNIISVPGVPKEMEHLILHSVIPYLQLRWNIRTVIHTRVIHTSGLGEAALDNIVGEFEQWTNPTVGLLAKSGIVDIRVGAKADTGQDADNLIEELINQIVPKLGKHVYGYDETTLLDSIRALVQEFNYPISIKAYGFSGKLHDQIAANPIRGLDVQDLSAPQRFTTHPLVELITNQLVFQAELHNDVHPAELYIEIQKAELDTEKFSRKFGGPPAMAVTWAINTVLDLIRITLMDQLEKKG